MCHFFPNPGDLEGGDDLWGSDSLGGNPPSSLGSLLPVSKFICESRSTFGVPDGGGRYKTYWPWRVAAPGPWWPHPSLEPEVSVFPGPAGVSAGWGSRRREQRGFGSRRGH